MQCNVVKAFRQRLVRGGFTDISIIDNFDGTYGVWCTSCYNEKIRVNLTVDQMRNIPRLVYFEDR